jgi:hypothetical protein
VEADFNVLAGFHAEKLNSFGNLERVAPGVFAYFFTMEQLGWLPRLMLESNVFIGMFCRLVLFLSCSLILYKLYSLASQSSYEAIYFVLASES